MNYKELRVKFKEVLSSMTEKDIYDWLKKDYERLNKNNTALDLYVLTNEEHEYIKNNIKVPLLGQYLVSIGYGRAYITTHCLFNDTVVDFKTFKEIHFT